MNKLKPAAILALALLSTTGCAKQSNEPAVTPTAIGASMEQGGIMSQADYVHIRQIDDSTRTTHQLSDTDLNYVLTLLQSAKNSIPRARAMTALAEMRPMPADQKSKIIPAITPFLTDGDKLDELSAKRVQKAAQ